MAGILFDPSATNGMSSSVTGIAAITSLVVCLVIILYSLRCLYGCCIRRRRQSDQGLPMIIAIGAPQFRDGPRTGLDLSVIAALPTFVYKKPDETDGTDTGTGTGTTECSICLSVMEDEEMVKLLPNCSHLFHTDCIDMWLTSHTTCPICRAAADPQAPPVPEPEPEAQTNGTGDDEVPPTAPPLERLNSTTSIAEDASDEAAESSTVDASISRSNTFHRILSWTRSGRRIQPLEISAGGVEDPEKQ